MKNLISLLIIVLLYTNLSATLYKQDWEYRDGRYTNNPYDKMGLYIGKITSRNRPELIFIRKKAPTSDENSLWIIDGETKETICENAESRSRILGVFDLNRDGYNEVYTTYLDLYDSFFYSVLDTKDFSTRVDTFQNYATTGSWTLTYDEVSQDTVLVAAGGIYGVHLCIYSLPDLSVVRHVRISGEYIFPGIAVADFDNDQEKEIAVLAEDKGIFIINFETLETEYVIDIEAKQYVESKDFNVVDFYHKDGYPDFVFTVRADYEYSRRMVILDGKEKKQKYLSPLSTNYSRIAYPYETEPTAPHIIVADGKYDYLYNLVDYYGTSIREYWRSDSFPHIYNIAVGDLTGNGRDDVVVSCMVTYGYFALYLFNDNEVGFSSSGTSTLLPKQQLSCMPNPFTNRLTITAPCAGSVFDVTGRKLATLHKGKQTLQTGSWCIGVYVVRCGKETRRIVKIK